MRLTTLWIWLVAFASPLAFAVMVLRHRLNIVAFLLGGIVAVVVSGPLAALLVVFFPVRVGADGLHGYDFWGRRIASSCADARCVQPSHVIGLPVLLVGSGSFTRRLWLPLFLGPPDAFSDAVIAHGGSDHPLLIAFRNGQARVK